MEKGDHWDDLITLDRTFVYERAVIVSRETAHRQYALSPCCLASYLAVFQPCD